MSGSDLQQLFFFFLLFNHTVAISNDDLLGRDDPFLFQHLLFNKLNMKRLSKKNQINQGFFFFLHLMILKSLLLL